MPGQQNKKSNTACCRILSEDHVVEDWLALYAMVQESVKGLEAKTASLEAPVHRTVHDFEDSATATARRKLTKRLARQEGAYDEVEISKRDIETALEDAFHETVCHLLACSARDTYVIGKRAEHLWDQETYHAVIDCSVRATEEAHLKALAVLDKLSEMAHPQLDTIRATRTHTRSHTGLDLLLQPVVPIVAYAESIQALSCIALDLPDLRGVEKEEQKKVVGVFSYLATSVDADKLGSYGVDKHHIDMNEQAHLAEKFVVYAEKLAWLGVVLRAEQDQAAEAFAEGKEAFLDRAFELLAERETLPPTVLASLREVRAGLHAKGGENGKLCDATREILPAADKAEGSPGVEPKRGPLAFLRKIFGGENPSA